MVNCLTRASLRPGDHVANLMYGGDLYKGFLDLSLALIEATVPTLHLHIGVAPLDAQAWTIRTFSATVLVSMPTVVCRLADYHIEHKELPNTVRLVLYIGELLHNDQKKLLRHSTGVSVRPHRAAPVCLCRRRFYRSPRQPTYQR